MFDREKKFAKIIFEQKIHPTMCSVVYIAAKNALDGAALTKYIYMRSINVTHQIQVKQIL